METSSSGSTSRSTSQCSSGSSDEEEEVLEPVRIMGNNFQLPQDLCEDFNIFSEFFSLDTWENLDDEDKSHLLSFLPNSGGDDQVEQGEETVRMLLEREPFHFTSPLEDFFYNLRQGNYRPDIAKMKKVLIKATRKQQKHKLQSYYAKLLPEVLVTRERILAAAKSAPPLPSPMVEPPKPPQNNNYRPPHERAKERYFEELAAIRSEVGGNESDDENYPKLIMEPPVEKKKQITQPMSSEANVLGTLGSMAPSQTAIDCLKKVVATHKLRRQYRDNHPELHTAGITLEAIKQRVAIANGTRKLMFGGVKKITPIQKLRKEMQSRDRGGKTICPNNSLERGVPDNKTYDSMAVKIERDESDSENSTYVDPVTISPTPKQPRKRKISETQVKEEFLDHKYDNLNSMSYLDVKFNSLMDRDSPDLLQLGGGKSAQAVPIKIEDLDGIDMMTLPVELADDFQMDSLDTKLDDPMMDSDDLLAETTYANFLCLVRALFPSRTAHRASKSELHSRCANVLKSPIAPLNTWYMLSDDWCAELDSALDFLAGIRGPHPDDYVPYLQYIPETQVYQWIGAGRDGDAILARLCDRWMRASSPEPLPKELPPPRYPTKWVMRPPSSNEISEFRAQERRRFSGATKPFSYLQHGYRSVVGPCSRTPVTCMGFSKLVVTEKPRHATFLTLVRDAAARLPNGEGTIAHIILMLRMSQYLKPNPDDVWEDSVNIALNKLTTKRDPCVKYDYRTALWTYLHRDRTEDDWLKSMNPKSRPQKRSRPATATATATPPPPPKERKLSPLPIDLDIGSIEEVLDDGSDIDIDVDVDYAPPSPLLHMSSAQLLMQATKAHPEPKPAPRPHRAKLIPARPQTKPTPLRRTKQASKTSQIKTPKPSPMPKSNPSPKPSPPKSSPTPKSTPTPKPPIPTFNEKIQDKKVAKPEVNKTQKPILQSTTPKPMPTKQTQVQQTITKPVSKPVAKPVLANPAVQHVTPQVIPIISPVTSPNPVITQISPAVTHLPGNVTIIQGASQHIVMPKSSPSSVYRSQLIKQRPLFKNPNVLETLITPHIAKEETVSMPSLSPVTSTNQMQNKSAQQLPRSLLLKPPVSQTPAVECPAVPFVHLPSLEHNIPMARSLLLKPAVPQTSVEPSTPVVQFTTTLDQSAATAAATAAAVAAQRRSVVRVLSPAAAAAVGKSLISPRALLQPTTLNSPIPFKKRVLTTSSPTSTATATSASAAKHGYGKRNKAPVSVNSVVSVASSVPTTTLTTRTVQLTTGRTVQLGNHTVHLPHTLQLQLPTHSLRLPSGQTVQITTQQIKPVPNTNLPKTPPRQQTPMKPIIQQTSQPTIQIPVSTMHYSGQAVQIAGQSVQLTGHTVRLPCGKSAQIAAQPLQIPIQIPSKPIVQLAQTPSTPAQQLPQIHINPQTVQIGGQSVQLTAAQTLQLSRGQTIQLPNGQTLQLSGQALQLNQNQLQKQNVHLVRPPIVAGDKASAPLVAKLLANAQGQMISLENVAGGSGARTIQLTGLRPQMSMQNQRPIQVPSAAVQGPRSVPVPGVSGVRVLTTAGSRLTRPVLFTSTKSLHNIILQQSDGSTTAVRMSTPPTPTSQTVVISNIGSHAPTTPTPTSVAPPVIKLQQGAGSSAAPPAGGAPVVRNVVMDGQQLKFIGGRHLLARLIRQNQQPHQQQQQQQQQQLLQQPQQQQLQQQQQPQQQPQQQQQRQQQQLQQQLQQQQLQQQLQQQQQQKQLQQQLQQQQQQQQQHQQQLQQQQQQ